MPSSENRSGGIEKSNKKCPVCNVELIMSERQGIEIDYCSECRGVWLDRGELDKIIKHSLQLQNTSPLDSGEDVAQDAAYLQDGDYRDERDGRDERAYREESSYREDSAYRVGNHGGGHGRGRGHGGGHGGGHGRRHGGGHGGRSWLRDLFH